MVQEPVVDPQRPSKTRKNSSRADAPGGAAQPSLRGRALRLLGRREFSRQELDKRLSAYAENPEELAALLDDLSERGWLSDARYAEALVRKRAGQYARRSIAQELKQVGISADVTDAALAEVNPDEEFAAALALCLRKFRHAPVDQKEKARQIRFLQARGYSLNLALRVLKHGRAGEDSGD